jgi:hypothetical protein
MFIAKSEVFVFKTKGLEGSTWIKNGAIVKETLLKGISISTPQIRGWSFLVNRIKKTIIEK